MKIIRSLNSSNLNSSGCVATIGNFDGLHLGHQKIISSLRNEADKTGLPLTVISFEPLPSEYFMPEPPARVYPLRDKIRLLQKLGVNHFVCLRFNAEFASLKAEHFIQTILLEQLNVKYLAVGDDFRFGFQRKGDFSLLQEIGGKAGMTVVDTATCKQNNDRVSSTRIRQHLQAAEIQQANHLLGFNYILSGRIRHGDTRGRTIGFPTLNLKLPDNIAPRRGVYAVRVMGLGDSCSNSVKNGVANLGTRPTVKGTENRLEIHLFDFDQDVYGKYICVEMIEFIRDEKRFDDFNALKTQILDDAKQAVLLLRDRI